MPDKNVSKSKKNKILKRFPFGWIFALIIFYLLVSSLNFSMTGLPQEISYSTFYQILKTSPEKIKSLTKVETELRGEFIDNTKFRLNIPDNDQELLSLIRDNVTNFEVKPARTFLAALLFNLGPIMLLMLFWWVMFHGENS